MKKVAKKPHKDAIINVRCTKKQKELLEKTAASEGLGLSTWLLRTGILAARKEEP